jgi:hypothetical protein
VAGSRKYSGEQATKLAKERGFYPVEDYPGRARDRWIVRCATKGCGAVRRVTLSELRLGRVCKHSGSTYAPRKVIRASVADLVKGYEDGATIRALAVEYGFAYGTVQRLLHDGGAELRARGGRGGGTASGCEVPRAQ